MKFFVLFFFEVLLFGFNKVTKVTFSYIFLCRISLYFMPVGYN